ncbi:MAG: site-specific integrase [Lachnospiraceae bacterium]|nr:site-specific integrase [Lachnospiraceae bacterium]
MKTNDFDDLLDQFVVEFKQRLQDPDRQPVDFYDYSVKWFETYKKCKEYNTRVMYDNIINTHFQRYFHNMDVRQLDLYNCQGLINENIDHPRTCQLLALTLKQVLKSAVRDGLFSSSAYEKIFSGLSLPKKKKPQKRPLTDIERKAVFEADLSPMKHTFLYLLYYTGIRKGEALALRPDDFDFENGSVLITKTLIFTSFSDSELKFSPKSENGFREIPLPEECISLIRPYISSCDGFLFRGQGAVLANRSFYRRFWESILTGLNIAAGYNPWKKGQVKPIQGLTAHIFRHDYCTQLCYQVPDISTKMIAQLMGDSEKMVLDVYSHLMLEKEKVLSSITNARKHS